MGMRPVSLATWPASDARRPSRSPRPLIYTILALILALCAHGLTDEQLRALRQETRDIFYHGFDNYMKHAFPEDELRPLSCAPLTRDRENPAHIELNDVLGNYSLTLIDSLSTLAILASAPEKKNHDRAIKNFEDGIASLVGLYGDGTAGPSGQGTRARGFDLDSKVQVFETVIRGVGGLLSAHLFAVGDLPIAGYSPKTSNEQGIRHISFQDGFKYHGQLLNLARDLGERLLPAFDTPTGLPYPRVNLRHGTPFYASPTHRTDAAQGECPLKPPAHTEITETCSAGAGSLVLEFTTLSRLTGEGRFERVAKKAFWAVWDRRSSVGLIGAGIDAETGQWVGPYTGIGAGIDSFFEYALKSHILLSGLPYPSNESNLHSPDAFLATWQSAHEAIHRHIYRENIYQHPHYIQADLNTGAMRAFWIDSLSAYYPGLLTLAGELDEAVESHLLYTALWTRYSALPERWSTATGNVEMGLHWWGGRPEFIESTWYIYRATKDPWYLHVGEMALRDIKRRCWTKCGWAGLQDVRSGQLSDRMESFFLGETAKYMYLLFDERHPLNHLDAPFVFTTEGHPLIIPKRLRNAAFDQPATHAHAKVGLEVEVTSVPPTCQIPPDPVPFSISATAARSDIFHAASLARLHLMPTIETLSSPLIEFTPDHPSISLSDIRSPSNYTFYPWTLPLELVPPKGMSSKMAQRSTFDLSFPTLPDHVISLGSLQRTSNGVFINAMSGLRLGMIIEPSGYGGSDQYRIQAVSNIPLGRDESVFLRRDTIADFNPVDPYFTRSRDTSTVDLVIDALPEQSPSATAAPTPIQGASMDTSMPVPITDADLAEAVNSFIGVDDNIASTDPSFLEALVQSLQAILSESPDTAISPAQPPPRLRKPVGLERIELTATLPTGPGAAPLPDTPDPPELADPAPLKSPLIWNTIHVLDSELCEGEKLPAEIARNYNVLVIRRGGCSFSTKLQNIPAVPPSSRGLQLLIVVSFQDHEVEDWRVSEERRKRDGKDKTKDGKSGPNKRKSHASYSGTEEMPLIQPLLDAPQLTPGGLPRPHPQSMLMVSGGQETMDLLARARGVGVRRRLWFMTQGVKIGNLIVL